MTTCQHASLFISNSQNYLQLTPEFQSCLCLRICHLQSPFYLLNHSLAGYRPDCGRRHEWNDGKKVPGTPFLSFKKAAITNAQKHVGRLLDTTSDGAKDTLVPFPLSAPTGAHNFSETGLCYKTFKKCCGTCMRQKPSVLEPYGIGLVLYFKFLKLMTVVFLLMR